MPTVDLVAAKAFLTTHGRLLDRRRLGVLLGSEHPGAPLAALAAYRNPDGGYGWGLEPDLRAPESQPVGATHALEVLVEAGAAGDPSLFDWLERHSLPDGGLPFALPVADQTGLAAHWAQADPGVSSLQMTSQVVAHAVRLARRHRSVAELPWLATATRYCLEAIAQLDQTPSAYELEFILRFLDALPADVPERATLLETLRPYVLADGPMLVAGGVEGEALHPLDFAPDPNAPARGLFDADVVAADLDRLASLQQPDGGWTVDFASVSATAALEWRGYATVRALQVLRANGRWPMIPEA